MFLIIKCNMKKEEGDEFSAKEYESSFVTMETV